MSIIQSNLAYVSQDYSAHPSHTNHHRISIKEIPRIHSQCHLLIQKLRLPSSELEKGSYLISPELVLPIRDSLMAQMVKNPPAMQETQETRIRSGHVRDGGLIPGLGRSPGEGNG